MKEENFSEYEIYDAKDKVLGRLASIVAKKLLQGKKVAIVNAEQLIITGNRDGIIKKYKTRLDLNERSNPEHAAYWPRRPDMLVKRIIRGMLPYHKKAIGKDSYRRLRVFIGVPEVFKDAKIISIDTKSPKDIYADYMRISELSEMLGYKR
ncbi:MAG: 50S ribosomal protein L13 [Candidatus Micrarchaeia archaeon]